MICRNCGFSNIPDVIYCVRCGVKLEAEETKPSPNDNTSDTTAKKENETDFLIARLDDISARLVRIEAIFGFSQQSASVENPPSAASAPLINSIPVPSVAEPAIQVCTAPVMSRETPWEAIIGGKWTLWFGAAAVFLALAFFLVYAWKFLGPDGRFNVGILLGLTFLIAGVWFRERMDHTFGEGLTGAGLALLYLSLWAGYYEFTILSFLPAFIMMFCICALGIYLSLRFNTQSMSILAALGGFLTPAILGGRNSGVSSPFSFLLYVTLLIASVLAVSLFKHWRPLTWICFAASVLLISGWWDPSIMEDYRWMVFTFLSVDFLLILSASCFGSVIRKEEMDPENLPLVFSNAFIYTLAGYALIDRYPFKTLGYFFLILCFLFAVLTWLIYSLRQKNRVLKYAMAILSVFYFTTGMIYLINGDGWCIAALILEATGILTAALRFDNRRVFIIGMVVWGIALLDLQSVLFWAQPAESGTFDNNLLIPLLVWVIANGWLAYWSIRCASKTIRIAPSLFSVSSVIGGAVLIPMEVSPRHTIFNFTERLTSITYISAFLLSIYALGVFMAGIKARRSEMRVTAFFVILFSLFLAVWQGEVKWQVPFTPFFNMRMLVYITLAIIIGVISAMYSRRNVSLGPDETFLSRISAMLALVALLYGLSQETYATLQYSLINFGRHWENASQMGISLVWTLYALATLIGGFIKRARSFRIAGLALLGITVLKSVLIDLSFLDLPFRILTFAGLGVGLIIISWLYSRYGVGKETLAP